MVSEAHTYTQATLAQSEMDRPPAISVVMGVFNGGDSIKKTVDSVLSQSFTDFELLVINDGSTDGTQDVLEELEKQDDRIRVFNQLNTGLTSALILGCREARGEFIARQDCGDRSLPDRFARQLALLKSDPEVVAVGLGASRIGPQGEALGDSIRSLNPTEVTNQFLEKGIAILHPGSMYRRDAYFKVGGYRPEFRVAQDHDLWYRLCEVGKLAECPEVLFEMQIEEKGISVDHNDRQTRLAKIAKECYLARISHASEAELLESAKLISQEAQQATVQTLNLRKKRARSAYFIGSQLFARRDRKCLGYLRQAIILSPLAPKAWAKFIVASVSFR